MKATRRLSLCGLLALAGCWTSAQHGELIDQRLATLEADDQDQRKQIQELQTQLQGQLPKMDAKLAELDEALGRLNSATHRSGADVAVRMDELQGQMQQLRGLMEETQHRLDQLQSVTQSSAQEADRKLAAALGPQALADATAKEKAQKIAVADRPGLYAQAFKLYSSGAPADMDVARELFQEYLRRYPNDPQAGEAQYYAADCYLQAKRFKEAALAFQKVPDQYPKSSKVCEARYKLGLCFMGLKMRDDAKAALEETLKSCSGKAALAKEVKAKLSELGKPDKARKSAVH
jgi:TolA-binding protein